MAKRLAETELRGLALVGAQARLSALQAEISALLATFPELRGGRALRAAAGTLAATRRGGRKRPMSAAEKKVVSERMKKYWAERRAAKK